MKNRYSIAYVLLFVAFLGSAAIFFYGSHSFFRGTETYFYQNEIESEVSSSDADHFLRVKKNLGATSSEITLLFVGDIMLSRAIGSIMEKRQDWTHPFLLMKDFLSAPDLTVGNLEGPISERGMKVGSIYSFRADPRSVDGLAYAGFDIVSIANNHMWDYGEEAFLDTLGIVSSRQVAYMGGGKTFEEAHAPVIKDIRGTKIAFLGYTNLLPSFLGKPGAAPSVAFPDKEQMSLDIKNAREQADIVVVSFHAGEEYMPMHNAYQETIAHAAVDAGAHLVIGHHPHVIQDIEIYKGAYIAYSLGNFVFDQNFSPETGRGLVVKVIIKDKKIVVFEPHEVGFSATYQPFLKR